MTPAAIHSPETCLYHERMEAMIDNWTRRVEASSGHLDQVQSDLRWIGRIGKVAVSAAGAVLLVVIAQSVSLVASINQIENMGRANAISIQQMIESNKDQDRRIEKLLDRLDIMQHGVRSSVP